MTKDEIEIGAVYRCRGGWYRRPTHIEEHDGVQMVDYDLGWNDKVDKSSSRGPLLWFSMTAKERVR